MQKLAGILVLTLLAVPAWADRPPPPVVVAPVRQVQEIIVERTLLAEIVAIKDGVVGAETGGIIDAYELTPGDLVTTETTIAVIRPRRMDLLEAQLKSANATLALRKQELAELEAGSREEDIRQGQARLEQAEATLELRKWKVKAAERLFAVERISEDELTEERLTLRGAEAAVRALKAVLERLEKGEREERILQAKARVSAADAEVERVTALKRPFAVKAPFKGYVVEEHIELGQSVSEGDPLVRVVSLDQVDIRVPVLQEYVPALVPGTTVKATVDGLPAESRVLEGVLHRILPVADRKNRTVAVTVRVTNPKKDGRPLLRVGMSGRVTFELPVPGPLLLVPKDALVLQGSRASVYVVDPQTSIVRPVGVVPSVAKDDEIVVRGELKAGDQVVVKGNERLRPGQKVRTGKAAKGS